MVDGAIAVADSAVAKVAVPVGAAVVVYASVTLMATVVATVAVVDDAVAARHLQYH